MLRREAVAKLNEGSSGKGNALFRVTDALKGRSLESWVRDRISGLANLFSIQNINKAGMASRNN